MTGEKQKKLMIQLGIVDVVVGHIIPSCDTLAKLDGLMKCLRCELEDQLKISNWKGKSHRGGVEEIIKILKKKNARRKINA